MMNIFDQRLSELLTDNGLSKRSLANHVSVSAQSVSDWSTGKVQPTADMLIKLADFFGCTIDYLVGREDDFGNVTAGAPSSDLSEDEKKVLSLFKRMPEARQRTVLDLLEGLSDDSAERGGEKRRA